MIENVITLSETGLRRSTNQDEILAIDIQYAGLFAVADGMGGHYKGELASKAAIDILKNWWEEVKDSIDSTPFLELVDKLEKKVKEINEKIFWMYQEIKQQGGTTLCVLLIYHDSYAVLNIGDSRLYRCKGKVCTQLTKDDVWENQPQIKRLAEVEDIQKSPYYGRLQQALGAQKELAVSVFTGAIEKKMCFLLCSDGIYKYCEESYLWQQLKKIQKKKDAIKKIEQIREMVYKNGAKDNLSLVLVMTD